MMSKKVKISMLTTWTYSIFFNVMNKILLMLKKQYSVGIVFI